MNKIKSKFWHVIETERDLLHFSLKEEFNFNKRLNHDHYVLFFYKITVIGISSISPIKIKMYRSKQEFLKDLTHSKEHFIEIRDEIVNFKKHPIEYPFIGVIELTDKFLLKVEKERDKQKLISQLDKAYRSLS
ncbi:hypothetical protein [Metabacillus fastidiosus]|uniref:hypothetical protein n=1 Tax=Metabacillus fastidiosus TaxID=1458 RepID=UPI0008260953|nr:hypothetical protein [Metabacillus fastidiosus]